MSEQEFEDGNRFKRKVHWRDSMREPRLMIFDARLVFFSCFWRSILRSGPPFFSWQQCLCSGSLNGLDIVSRVLSGRSGPPLPAIGGRRSIRDVIAKQ